MYYFGQQKNVNPEGKSKLLSEFKYDPNKRITLPAYFRRYETIFTKGREQWSDGEKNHFVSPKIRQRGEH